ncbi:hypothetical protein, partial [uncultured Providencia sp.]
LGKVVLYQLSYSRITFLDVSRADSITKTSSVRGAHYTKNSDTSKPLRSKFLFFYSFADNSITMVILSTPVVIN